MYRTKHLKIKKLGWRRVANEFERLGWIVDDATKHTDTTTTRHYDVYEDGSRVYTGTTTNTKVFMTLDMHRDLDEYSNGKKVHAIDVLFSLSFLLRRIFGFLMPVAVVIWVILLLVGDQSMNGFFIGVIVAYFVLLILEIVFSYIGEAILKDDLHRDGRW